MGFFLYVCFLTKHTYVMKKIFTLSMLLSLSITSYSQVIVNNENLNEVAESFELYSAIKPFTTEECVFIDYGQDKFKPNNYDLKDLQAVYDKDGNKFKKGEYRKLVKYLESEGWKATDKRTSKIGNIETNITIYERIK